MAAEHPGIFITFEGGDGAGKSTHIRFLAKTLTARGYEVLCLREPGGTAIGEALRALVLDPEHGEMDPKTELLIYEAARAQIVAEVIRPALARGAVVLCDRFADSTVAYQGYGRGLDRPFIGRANAFACEGLVPDKTILMVSGLSAAAGLERATRREGADRLEAAGVDFHARVNAGFLEIARKNPGRVAVVESSHLRSETSAKVFEALSGLFPWMEECLAAGPAFFGELDLGHAHD
ncbi:MAG: dTMP kinase [Eggerthellaceae bacterium]|nr:dTMP kinase [Eggerthellaceae bacterium]